MSSYDQHNQDVGIQYNAGRDIVFPEGQELYSVRRPTDIIVKKNIKITRGLSYETSFKLKATHKILVSSEWRFTKSILNPFDWNLSNQMLYDVKLVVDGETKINLRDLSWLTLDYDELIFKLNNEDVSGKLILGGLGTVSV